MAGAVLLRRNVAIGQHTPSIVALDSRGRTLVENAASGELLEASTQSWASSHPPLPQPYFWFWGHVASRADATLLESDARVKMVRDREQAHHFTLTRPSKRDYRLSSPNTKSYSQWGQDLTLMNLLKPIKHGFFVEAGAKDGEESSNTLMYEKDLGWTGLLIEPNPKYSTHFPSKHRKAYFFNGCLSPSPREETLHFQDAIAGTGHLSGSGSMSVLGEPLQALLQDIGQKTVDFWSLDVEGSEATVLKATDFSKVEVGVLLVEMNKDSANNAGIQEVMDKEGFVNIGHTNDDHGPLDRIFINPKYYKARGLAVPSGSSLPPQNRN